MSKVGTLEHKKTKKLAKLAKVAPWAALGLLEAFWHWAGKYCPTGLLESDDFEACADTIGYKGKGTAELFKILSECGWIEPMGDGFYIHDWHDHAPDYVKKTLERTDRNFANGSPPYRKTKTGQRRDNGVTESGQGRDVDVPTKTNPTQPNQDQPNPTATGVVPSVGDLEIFMARNNRRNPEPDAVACWNHFDRLAWRDGKGEPIKNWRTFAGYWLADNPEKAPPRFMTAEERELMNR